MGPKSLRDRTTEAPERRWAEDDWRSLDDIRPYCDSSREQTMKGVKHDNKDPVMTLGGNVNVSQAGIRRASRAGSSVLTSLVIQTPTRRPIDSNPVVRGLSTESCATQPDG